MRAMPERASSGRARSRASARLRPPSRRVRRAPRAPPGPLLGGRSGRTGRIRRCAYRNPGASRRARAARRRGRSSRPGLPGGESRPPPRTRRPRDLGARRGSGARTGRCALRGRLASPGSPPSWSGPSRASRPPPRGGPLVDQVRDEGRPACLVRRANPRAIVPVEMLVEEELITPERVGLELPGASPDRTTPVLVLEKDVDHPSRHVRRYLPEARRALVTAGRRQPVLGSERGAKLAQALHDEERRREPERPSPVRVAALQLRRRLGGLVAAPSDRRARTGAPRGTSRASARRTATGTPLVVQALDHADDLVMIDDREEVVDATVCSMR